MKHFIMWVGILIAAGCTTESPMTHIIRDKEFSQYQSTLDQLESEYLRKEISYADYLEKKKYVENSYQKQVDTRRTTIQDASSIRLNTELGQ